MDRVAQLDLQECLHAATSSGEFELKESHLKTFSGIAKKHGEAVNEAIARCWDVISTIQISTPCPKQSKQLQREIMLLYSRFILSWKLIMFMCKKSQWAVRFLLEQPRLNVFCKAILHLISLAPAQRNVWEKPLARKLASLIYEDMVRLGALVDNQPLRGALEFLKRKKVKVALQPPTTARTRTPIDRFYYLKHAISLKDATASKIIAEITSEFPSQVPSFRSRQVTSSFEEVPDSSPKKIAPKKAPSAAPTKEVEEESAAPASSSPPDDDQDDFDDILFEDVEYEEPVVEELIDVGKVLEESAALEPPKQASPEDIRLEKLRQRNRDMALLVQHLSILKTKLDGIEERSNWIPNQITDYNAVSLRVTELLDILAACTQVNTTAITSAHNTSLGTQIIEFSSLKRG